MPATEFLNICSRRGGGGGKILFITSKIKKEKLKKIKFQQSGFYNIWRGMGGGGEESSLLGLKKMRPT